VGDFSRSSALPAVPGGPRANWAMSSHSDSTGVAASVANESGALATGPVSGQQSKPWALILFGVFALVQTFLFRSVLREDAAYAVLSPGDRVNYFVGSPTPFEWITSCSLLLIAAFTVVRTRFYRRWIFWRPGPPEAITQTVIGGIIAVILLVEAFAAASCRHGAARLDTGEQISSWEAAGGISVRGVWRGTQTARH
jgi:hypothetical protein